MTTTQPAGTERFQLSTEAAELYEARFVPAIFAEWAPRLVDIADVRPGHAVLDVASGTGIVARTVADRLGGEGRVVGLDLIPRCWRSPGASVRTWSGGRATSPRSRSRTDPSTGRCVRWR